MTSRSDLSWRRGRLVELLQVPAGGVAQLGELRRGLLVEQSALVARRTLEVRDTVLDGVGQPAFRVAQATLEVGPAGGERPVELTEARLQRPVERGHRLRLTLGEIGHPRRGCAARFARTRGNLLATRVARIVSRPCTGRAR